MEKSNSEKAIKKIAASVKKRFDTKYHKKTGEEFNVVYKRLRASAGRPITDSVIKRIEAANVVIIDITNNNKNVFIELGMALFFSKNNPKFSLYLIKEKIGTKSIIADLPSDLQGYFISEYTIENGVAKFKDNNSLYMSIVSDINDFYNSRGIMIEKIDLPVVGVVANHEDEHAAFDYIIFQSIFVAWNSIQQLVSIGNHF